MRKVTIKHFGKTKRFRVPSAADWRPVAEYLAGILKSGDAVALSGPLGAGKTTLVQALARVFGIKKTPASPTFALMRAYEIPGREPLTRLLHVDAYRLESEREMLALDLDEELSDGRTVLLIEWPEKIKKWGGARSLQGSWIVVSIK